MTKKKINIKQILIVILFAVVLFSARYVWIQYFSSSTQVEVEQGEVFIDESRLQDEQLQLVGNWAFYPNELLEDLPEEAARNRTFLEVPGGWQSAFDRSDEPYGYGTYHLRLHVDPREASSYSLRLYSVRAASKVFANGEYVGGTGTVSEEAETYEAFNAPYSTHSIRPAEDGTIDVLVQVSNFTDPRAGGIIRSVYFGQEEMVRAASFLSTILQVFAGTIFFVHAIFALIFYFVGIRDKAILYFALGLYMLSVISLNTGDEKIFLQLMKMDYVWSYKLSMISLFIVAIAIMKSLEKSIQRVLPRIVPIYCWILVILSVVSVIVPMDYLVQADYISTGSLLIAMMISIYSLIRIHFMLGEPSTGLILAFVAIMHHFTWFAYILQLGVKVIYYPFDLIIVVMCLASVWLKHYYDMNKRVKLQADRLEAADKEKDLFLANTAHELKNPLHSILNMSRTVIQRESSCLHEESVKDLEMVHTVSKRMTILVNDLLEMSLLDHHKPNLHIRQVSLQGVVAGTIHMNSYLLEGKDVTIVNRIAANFPSVMADENRLTQIMYNLIHNAVKFTEQGTITIDADVSSDQAVIHVIDTGPGIEEDVLAELFTPYRQGKARYQASEAGGLGLGLYITRQLVEYMSGEMDVQSTIGKGTTFTFTLPIGQGAITSSKESILHGNELGVQQERDLNDSNTELHGEDDQISTRIGENHYVPRLMVVDDDPINFTCGEGSSAK